MRVCRENDVFLVELDDVFILVDQKRGVMHTVNAAGAAAWACLGNGPCDDAFVQELRVLHLVADCPDGSGTPSGAVMATVSENRPRVLQSNMLLQVAASRPMHRGGWF